MNFNTITLHYTATYDYQDIGVEEITKMHQLRGFTTIGYHHLVRLDGTHEVGRPETMVGAHVKGHNEGNLGIVTVGGLRRTSGPSVGCDTRTPEQIRQQIYLIEQKLREYPTIERVVGHNELAQTLCPAYTGSKWWQGVRMGTPNQEDMTSENTGLPIRTRPLVHYGNKNSEVLTLQDALKKLGYFPPGTPSTGYFGEVTDRSVREFQEAKKLHIDGLVGNATWAAIIKEGGL